MSNTVLIKTRIKNIEAAKQVALAKGHKVLGEGKHQLYAGPQEGFGVQFKGWKYPAVFRNDGTVAYDNYHGSWGSQAELDDFRAAYTMSAARLHADSMGWYHETIGNDEKVVVHHPQGGTYTITPAGEIDANGFVGHACEAGTNAFAEALGVEESRFCKTESLQSQAEVRPITTE